MWTWCSISKNPFSCDRRDQQTIIFRKEVSNLHHRRSVRLPGHDYSQPGAYFVTICIDDRRCLCGEITSGEVVLSNVGKIVNAKWCVLPQAFPHVMLDAFVVMPNHLHGIVIITDDDGHAVHGRGLINQTPTTTATANPTDDADTWIMMKNRRGTLGKIIRHFKAKTAKYIHDSGMRQFAWQRNYHEHIIRDQPSMNRFRDYIRSNPAYWAIDHENPMKNP